MNASAQLGVANIEHDLFVLGVKTKLNAEDIKFARDHMFLGHQRYNPQRWNYVGRRGLYSLSLARLENPRLLELALRVKPAWIDLEIVQA